MIRIKRVNLSRTAHDKLDSLASNRSEWEKRKLPDEVMRALNRMFNGKCAYCERHAHTVEHFQPKIMDKRNLSEKETVENAITENLTWKWENMLWACAICQTKKRDSDYKDFINPCDEDPSDFLAYILITGELVAKNMGKGHTTISKLDLNSPLLVGARRRKIRRVFGLIRYLIDTEEDSRNRVILVNVLWNELGKNEEYLGFFRDILLNRNLYRRHYKMVEKLVRMKVNGKHIFWELIRQWSLDKDGKKLPKDINQYLGESVDDSLDG